MILLGAVLAGFVAVAGGESASLQNHLEQAHHFLEIENASRAASHFQEALQIDPRCVEALVALASLVDSGREHDSDGARLLAAAALARGSSDEAKALAEKLGLGSGPPADAPAERILVRYFGIDPARGSGRDGGGLGTGEKLRADLLLVAGLGADGRLVRLQPAYSVSSGLSIEGGDPATIRASSKPSTDESIVVTDARSGKEARAHVSVVGPATKLVISSSRARRAVLAEEPLTAGVDFTFGLGISDAAGNRLWKPRIEWSARAVAGSPDAAAWLVDRETVRHRDFSFESHRNHVVIPPAAKPEDVVEVTAREPESGASASFRVRLATEADHVVAKATSSIFKSTFEEALASAKADGKLAMIVFTAEW